MKALPPLDQLTADELESLVSHHNRLYWDEDAPEISDTDFDRLLRQLQQLKPDSPVIDALGPSRFGATVEHQAPMLSLDKCYSDTKLQEWADKVEGDFVVTPKIDGVACSLRYDSSGKLVQAATRGDGQRGEDVTANARRVAEIPQQLDTGQRQLEVRGELFMRLARFRSEYARDKANPRNLTAGAIKQKDPAKTAAYGLSFFAYDLIGAELERERDKLGWMSGRGFQTPAAELADRARLLEVVHAQAEAREANDFETDGVVIKADRLSEQRRLGATSHHPRFAIAFKFQGETGETALLDVEWSVSRTGTITPVALLDTISLKGVNVSRASLHNLRFVEELGLSAGCSVEVARRGDVIPHVERKVRGDGPPLTAPTQCPSCGSAVARRGDFLRCTEPDTCRAALIGTLAHFTKALDIEGFGPSLLEALVDSARVKRPADFFALGSADLLELKALRPGDKEVRIGAKLADKLVAAIQARRRIPLATFLQALGIDELGPVLAEKLASEFKSLEALQAVDQERLLQVHGVGSVVAANVVEGLRDLAPRIEGLLQQVELLPWSERAPSEHPLSGSSVLFTGKMATMDRGSAQRRVRELGGKTPGAVTKDLDYLVIGDKGSPLLGQGKKSTKHKAAERNIAAGARTRIVSESDFLKLLQQGAGT